jgi:hypothetical protein
MPQSQGGASYYSTASGRRRSRGPCTRSMATPASPALMRVVGAPTSFAMCAASGSNRVSGFESSVALLHSSSSCVHSSSTLHHGRVATRLPLCARVRGRPSGPRPLRSPASCALCLQMVCRNLCLQISMAIVHCTAAAHAARSRSMSRVGLVASGLRASLRRTAVGGAHTSPCVAGCRHRGFDRGGMASAGEAVRAAAVVVAASLSHEMACVVL